MSSYLVKAFLCFFLSFGFIGANALQSTDLPQVKKVDPTNHQLRLWHFVLRNVTVERAKWMVDRAQKNGFNGVVVMITDGVKFDNMPWTPKRWAWSKEDFQSWVKYAKEHGMEIIPEIKLLTHQEKFLQKKYPDLMYNSSTYNPKLPKVYNDIVFPFLNEIISIINPRTIHIGHDEVAGHGRKSANKWLKKRKWLGRKEVVLPANLYLLDIMKLHRFLKAKNINVAMWGDMLISKIEFPGMLSKHLHGNKPGYGKSLRQKLPKDIIIFDWHYFDDQQDFPSLSTLQREGFRVVSTTWGKEVTIRNFSKYAKKHNSYGLMASFWTHVPRKEWEKVDSILQKSGAYFRAPQ